MSQCDRYGLSLQTHSGLAAEAYRKGVDCLLAAWPGADTALEQAIALDSDFALAHAARARLHAIYAQTQAAKAQIAIAHTLVSLRGSDREKSHVEILKLAIEGQSGLALSTALTHLDKWPRDAIILSLPLGAFGLFAFSGRLDHNQARVDLCERHAGHYGDDWWFLTYLGWSHTENGEPAKGREIAERAFEKRIANANAVHALLHAMFEEGAVAPAQSLIKHWLPTYPQVGVLHGHISWHHALLALEDEDADQALAIYAASLQPSVNAAPPLNTVSDCVSLLWRLNVYGHPVAKHNWDDVAEYSMRVFPQTALAFANVHLALLEAAMGQQAALAERITALDQRMMSGQQPAGSVVADICRAAGAFAEGDYARCVQILEPASGEVTRIGGSHAQREVIEDSLLIALMKCGEVAKASALLDQRLHRRVVPRDVLWRASLKNFA